MFVDYFLEVFRNNPNKESIIWRENVYSYEWLLNSFYFWKNKLLIESVKPNSVVSLETDFSPTSIAIILALIECKCIIVPITDSVGNNKSQFRQIAQVEWLIQVDKNENVVFTKLDSQVDHSLLCKLKQDDHPGLVLFSSGSTGQSKAAVHDLGPLLKKFWTPRHSMRTLTFLLFDHIGGFNTLFYTLSNAGCIITVQERSPQEVCRVVQEYKVEMIPTSPSFMNLILISEAYKHYDMSSLKLVTYGTEVMPESTLTRFRKVFNRTRLLQTYGLSEIGILRSKSKSSDSQWVKVGGEDFQTRIVDGLLEIKAKSAMLGYLNADSPFTEDGWFKTGDAVEVDGEYIKILGRRSELINVGGQKVYPGEIESVLQLMEGIEDVSVCSEKNPITGHIVKAKIKLNTNESLIEFRRRMWAFCKDKLESYKIPQKIVLTKELLCSSRFKKVRK